MNKIVIFDIDGTLAESSCTLKPEHALLLNQLKEKYEIGTCGGGTLEKILSQMNDSVYFDHYFSECGCVYHKNNSKTSLDLQEMYKKNIRAHESYKDINVLIKLFLKYLSECDYELSGHFIDLRNGIVYLSCVGMQATLDEREVFKNIDSEFNIRNDILHILREKAKELNIHNKISINLGGSVGIGLYPVEYDKIQILDTIQPNEYEKIIYFGDKYEKNGNDYHIINDKHVIGYKIDNVEDTFEIIKNKLL